MMLTDKKTEVVYCRFAPSIYELVKDRAQAWGCSNADAIQRLCFVGGMAAFALDQSIVQKPDGTQAKARSETEGLLNKIVGPLVPR
jgi:hypothetical protein